jgi:hypothetical protein
MVKLCGVQDLHGGHVLLFDLVDWPVVRKYRWHAVDVGSGVLYAQAKITREEPVYLHRLLLDPGSLDVDHINRNGLDNRRRNLRLATRRQNVLRRPTINPTGYRGVFPSGKRWCARIRTSPGCRVTLGTFDTPEEAAEAYDQAARMCNGEFAILNYGGF